MSANTEYDLIIVGAGPSGATAAIYAKLHGLKTLLFQSMTMKKSFLN